MFTLLAFTILGQGKMFSSIVPRPTGQNGYEEYLAAADLVDIPEFNNYVTWLSTPRKDRNNLVEYRPQDVGDSDPDLTVRNKLVVRFERSLSLVSAGNRKPVHDPRDSMTPETLLPEFSQFRKLAKLEGAAAHVSFAYGDSSGAISHIQDGFIFCSKISSSTLISFLVGQASERVIFGELDDHWPQLSVTDARSVDTFLTAQLSSAPTLARSLKSEEDLELTTLDEVLSKPDLAGDMFTDAEAGLPAEIGKLSSTDLRSTRDSAAGEIVKQFDKALAIVNGPESGWLPGKGLLPEDLPYDPTESLDRRLAKAVMPNLRRLLMVAERERTQARLALLTSKAIEYRWINGHLPGSIEEFTTATERTDPSTGKSYRYKLEAQWFRIFRDGVDQLGTMTTGPQPKPALGVSADGPSGPR